MELEEIDVNGPVPVTLLDYPPFAGNLFGICLLLLSFIIPLVLVLLLIRYLKNDKKNKAKVLKKFGELIASIQKKQNKEE